MAKCPDCRLRPFLLTVVILIADQISKYFVAHFIPVNSISSRFLGDFFWLVHQRNTGAAFSLGHNLPESGRILILIVLPILVVAGLAVYLYRTNELNTVQRWAVAGIIGGGFGNLIDRVFRPAGVVDFLSVKFYGLFGLERWPTFNIADASVVVCGILLVVGSLFFGRKKAE